MKKHHEALLNHIWYLSKNEYKWKKCMWSF